MTLLARLLALLDSPATRRLLAAETALPPTPRAPDPRMVSALLAAKLTGDMAEAGDRRAAKQRGGDLEPQKLPGAPVGDPRYAGPTVRLGRRRLALARRPLW
ncbi:MAG TPA: hypothetical protein VLT47_10825 [Anaeromyxobacteraceae bacterium]|nr:hypothetical protein [Anaeromyxobacteraceae bacterium]